MTLIDTLRPEHRRWLRRLRKRIANRENMRRYRSDITRCTACRKRRHWLLTHAFNPVEVGLSALLDGAEHDDGAREDFGQAAPLLDELFELGDPCLRW